MSFVRWQKAFQESRLHWSKNFKFSYLLTGIHEQLPRAVGRNSLHSGWMTALTTGTGVQTKLRLLPVAAWVSGLLLRNETASTDAKRCFLFFILKKKTPECSWNSTWFRLNKTFAFLSLPPHHCQGYHHHPPPRNGSKCPGLCGQISPFLFGWTFDSCRWMWKTSQADSCSAFVLVRNFVFWLFLKTVEVGFLQALFVEM